jgi:hypothetical protein
VHLDLLPQTSGQESWLFRAIRTAVQLYLATVGGCHATAKSCRPPSGTLATDRSLQARYQIIVGLAITLACTKLFPDGVFRLSDVSFWLFCTFFITVVPIFHGGDRSLDIKYLRAQPIGFWRTAAYVWDVYVLLITAILFVKIAQAIPGGQAIPGAAILGAGSPQQATPQLFYGWTAAMLIFDIFVLGVDWLKSGLLRTEGKEELSAYFKWIGLNLFLATVCLLAIFRPSFLASLSANTVSIIVFAFAFSRTVLDYTFGKKFMFP